MTAAPRISLGRRRGLAAGVILAAGALIACSLYWVKEPPSPDAPWLEIFSRDLEDKTGRAEAVVVADRVMTLGDRGVVSLYRLREILKGRQLIERVMARYPEVEGSVLVAYESSASASGRREPAGPTIVFMTAPRAAGKNLRLLGDRVDEGMVQALPRLVTRIRSYCR